MKTYKELGLCSSVSLDDFILGLVSVMKKHGLEEFSSEGLDQKLFESFRTFNRLCSEKGTEVRFHVNYFPSSRSAPTARVGVQRAGHAGLVVSKDRGWRISVSEQDAVRNLAGSPLQVEEWVTVAKPFL